MVEKINESSCQYQARDHDREAHFGLSNEVGKVIVGGLRLDELNKDISVMDIKENADAETAE